MHPPITAKGPLAGWQEPFFVFLLLRFGQTVQLAPSTKFSLSSAGPKVWKRSSPQPGPFSTGWLLWAYARMHRVVAWGSGIVYWTLSPISMCSHQPPGAIEEQASYGSSRSPLIFIFLQNVCSFFSMLPIAAIDTVDEALISGGLAHGRWFYESFVSLKETKVSRWQT